MSFFTEEIRALLTGGTFGTVVRILLNPDKEWKKWIVQAFVGVSAAVFLGGVITHLIIMAIGPAGADAAGYAAGYLIGTGAEKAIEKLQKRFLE